MAGVGHDKHCCVPFCNGNGRLHKELSFHKIPTRPDIRKAWIQAIKRDPGPYFTITKETVVCSRHFKPDDFKWTPIRKTLKPESIPSVFNWAKEVTPRRSILKHPLPEKRQKLEDHVENHDNVDPLPATSEYEDCCPLIQPCDVSDREKIQILENMLKEKDREIGKLQQKLEIERFGIERFSKDDSMIMFYTGFISFAIFSAFFDFIKPAANSMTSYYYKMSANTNPNILGRQRNMLLIDELFMFLCRLKCGLLEQDLAVRFNCHLSTVSRKIITWTNFMYFALGSINIWPSREQIYRKMPDCFKCLYLNTRIIIDCTEIKTERPSSLVLGSKFYSTYKSSHTWKGLVGIAPHGALTFVSSLYTGCISDVEITKLSGLIELLERGDSVMADKGFTLQKVLEGTGIDVNTPPFLMSQGQFTAQEVEETQAIARLRIHIERHIRRVKEFHLFDAIIPLSMVGSINQLWTVANMLTLFRGPLVKDWS